MLARTSAAYPLCLLALLFSLLAEETVAAEKPRLGDKAVASIGEPVGGIDRRLQIIERKLESLETLIVTGFVVVFISMMALVALVILDRRSAMNAAIRKSTELRDSRDRIMQALRQIAKTDTNMAIALRHQGLLDG